MTLLKKVLKNVYPHVGLTWKKAVSCTLEMYQPLTSYILSGSEKQARLKGLTNQFENLMTEVCLLVTWEGIYPILLNSLFISNTNLIILVLRNS